MMFTLYRYRWLWLWWTVVIVTAWAAWLGGVR